MPAACAASSFCFTPPIGSTRPVSDTSPVIARSDGPADPTAADARAVVIVTPPLGPSSERPPAGTCTCTPRSLSYADRQVEFASVRLQVASAICRHIHHVAELTGQGHPGTRRCPSGAECGLDEEHVTTAPVTASTR